MTLQKKKKENPETVNQSQRFCSYTSATEGILLPWTHAN